MIGTKHYLNINYLCNERCTFCASDLTNNLGGPRADRQLDFETVLRWIHQQPPGPHDRILLAGGEPTLHPDLDKIAGVFSAFGVEVTLFTNGLRFSNEDYTRRLVETGISRFEIAIFGSTAETHDAITRVHGSFDRTIRALENLVALRLDHTFTIQVRLLVSRQCYRENPAIVEVINRRVPGVDEFSLNRLILSDHARMADATVSWRDARASINEVASQVLRHGYKLIFGGIPLCLFEKENAAYIHEQTRLLLQRIMTEQEPSSWNFRYLDPVVAEGKPTGQNSRSNLALLDLCQACEYLSVCGRVEDWYVQLYGAEGLGLST